MALSQAKKELRKHIKHKLSTVSQESINRQTISTLNTLFGLPEYQKAKKISIYLSMPAGEISTAGIVHSAFHQGKKVFIPYTYRMRQERKDWPSSIMDMIELESLADYQSLQPDKWGIPTLSPEAVRNRQNAFGTLGTSESEEASAPTAEGLDIIVMPGMAFDRYLERLGHGRGYYDFFLQRYLQHTRSTKIRMPFLVGLSLEEQLLPEDDNIPSDETDYKLDALIVGNGEIIRSTGKEDS